MRKVEIELNIAASQLQSVHGYHDKIGIVLHETVSPQIMHSLADVIGVSRYVASVGYGIHGITDNDGNKAWARGLGTAIFYHTASFGDKHHGVANQNFIGIEQVSDVMVKYRSRAQRIKAWLMLQPELNATAMLIACAARAHKFPIQDNPGDTTKPGITTHWEVTDYNGVAGGHSDCWPSHRGGYYPKRLVIKLAQRYYDLGYHF